MERATLPKLQSRVPRQRNRRTHGWHALRARAQHAPLGGASEADTVRRLQCWRRPKPSRESSKRGARHDAQALRARGVQATARTERRGRVVSGGTASPRMHLHRARSGGVSACGGLRSSAQNCTGPRLDTRQTHARLRVGCRGLACKRAEHPAAPLACKSGFAVCCATHNAVFGLAHGCRAPLPRTAAALFAGAATAAQQTCRNCRRPFLASDNGPTACVWHPQLFTGGELGKYTGYVPESPAFEHRMKVRKRFRGVFLQGSQQRLTLGPRQKRGMVRFWDCCGATDEAAPGCMRGPHKSYDDE